MSCLVALWQPRRKVKTRVFRCQAATSSSSRLLSSCFSKRHCSVKAWAASVLLAKVARNSAAAAGSSRTSSSQPLPFLSISTGQTADISTGSKGYRLGKGGERDTRQRTVVKRQNKAEAKLDRGQKCVLEYRAEAKSNLAKSWKESGPGKDSTLDSRV